MHSNGSLAVLAPIILNERSTQNSVLVQDWNGGMQSWQRFLHQLGDIPVQYHSTAPQGSVKDGGTKQIVLSLSKQYTETGLGSSGTGGSRRDDGCNTELVRKCSTWTSDAHCWTRRIASCGPDCQLGHWFRSVLLLLDFSLEGALRKTAWLADRAFGVVTTRSGLAVRAIEADFEEVVKLVQPEN